jgi:NDP-sugar pyrophosphorylase family protein
LKAAILAGGAGTRLYPLTTYLPKALIPLGNRYVIEYIIDYLKQNEISDIVMLVSINEVNLLRNHLQDGSRYGVHLEYSVAERLGTAGALGAARELLSERFIVYYGDVLTNMNLREMIQLHDTKRAVCTLAVSTSVPIEYGVARVAPDGRVSFFEEKPVLDEYPVSMGIDVFEEEALAYCKPNTDIAEQVIPSLLKEGKTVYAYVTEKRHYDIGTFKTLEEVRQLIENGNLFKDKATKIPIRIG